ncbi:hypothetical protein D3C80_2013320 [compost metagenome]
MVTEEVVVNDSLLEGDVMDTVGAGSVVIISCGRSAVLLFSFERKLTSESPKTTDETIQSDKVLSPESSANA